MAMLPFYTVKCTVNGIFYTIAELSIDDGVTDIEITNTEGIGVDADDLQVAVAGWETHMGGNSAARVTAKNASFDTTENPFVSPRGIISGTFISFEAFTLGPGTPGYNFPSLFIVSTNWGGNIKQGQPVSFSGISNGKYYFPGED